jgi:signal recognition particle subunit SRP54
MLDPGKPSFTPKKGKPSVVMFVGLQGWPFIAALCTFAFELWPIFLVKYQNLT